MMTIAQESQWSSRMTRALIAGLLLTGFATNSLAADPVAGQKIFRTQCRICHATPGGKNGLGPGLKDNAQRADLIAYLATLH